MVVIFFFFLHDGFDDNLGAERKDLLWEGAISKYLTF